MITFSQASLAFISDHGLHFFRRFRTRQGRDDPDSQADAGPSDDHRRDPGCVGRAGAGNGGEADQIARGREPTDMAASPALSLIKKAQPTLQGRKIGLLVTDGVDDAQVHMLRKAVEKEGAAIAVIAPKAAAAKTQQGELLPADQALSAAPSIFFDAVALLTSEDGAARLAQEAAAVDWLRDASAT
jgi:catalase